MELAIIPLGSGRSRLNPAERVRVFQEAAQAIRALNDEAEKSRGAALTAIHSACNARLAVGIKLLEIKTAFSGDFDEWLEGYCSEWFSRRSAYRWIAVVNDLKATLGSPDPTFKQLCDAQRAIELLPEPFSTEETKPANSTPLFRIAFSVNTTPPQEWSSHQRREFLEKSKPIVELYAQVAAAESS
ncbi:MAG: hypothetical protein V4710_11065 [Verrucomicrobiota bacterium]